MLGADLLVQRHESDIAANGELIFDYTTNYGGIPPTLSLGLGGSGSQIVSASTWHPLTKYNDAADKLLIVALAMPGDANVDNSVDGTDLNTVLSNYGMTSGADLGHGRLQRRRGRHGTDLNIVLSNYGAVSPA